MDSIPYLTASDGLLARNSGDWAKRKHHFLGNYCGITTVSMRQKFKLVYLDVMAGPGRCKIEETGEEFPDHRLLHLNMILQSTFSLKKTTIWQERCKSAWPFTQKQSGQKSFVRSGTGWLSQAH